MFERFLRHERSGHPAGAVTERVNREQHILDSGGNALKSRRWPEPFDVPGRIPHLRQQPAHTLSGGEKRRCEIARALTTNPKILLLDEPFVGIDPITVAEIQGMLQILKKKGLGILITDHNVQATLEVVDRASIVFEGKILTSGNSHKLLTDPEARRVYLGEKFHI